MEAACGSQARKGGQRVDGGEPGQAVLGLASSDQMKHPVTPALLGPVLSGARAVSVKVLVTAVGLGDSRWW